MRNRRGRILERGFSLIELGIVVAVIAILATVVLVGRGFLQSSRVTKMVEVIDTVAKGMAVYAGTNGGKLPTGIADYKTELIARALITRDIATSVPDFTVGVVGLQAGSLNEQFNVPITCTGPQAAQMCQDLCLAKRRDQSIVAINGAAVPAPPAVYNCPAQANVTFRHRL